MQIHELNNFSGDLDSGAYLAVDNGTDTGKVLKQDLLKSATDAVGLLDTELNARIDNIIAGGTAPSAAEVTDARIGANGDVYSSLGTAIREADKVITGEIETFANSKLINLIDYNTLKPGFINGNTGAYTSGASGSGLDRCTDFIKVSPGETYNLYAPTGTNWNMNIVEYDGTKSFIKGTAGGIRRQILDASTEYIRVSLQSTSTAFGLLTMGLVQTTIAESSTLLTNIYNNEIVLSDENLIHANRIPEDPYMLNSLGLVTRVTTNKPLFCKKGTIVINNWGGYATLYRFNSSLIFQETIAPETFDQIEIAEDSFICINFAKRDTNETIQDSEIPLIANSIIMVPPEMKSLCLPARKGFKFAGLRNGSVNNQANTLAVSTGRIIPVNGEESFTIVINRPLSASGHCYRFQYTTYSIASGLTGLPALQPSIIDYDITTVMSPDKTKITVNPKSVESVVGWAFAIYEVTDETASTYVPIRIDELSFDSVLIVSNYENSDDGNNYLVGSDLMKKHVEVTKVGALQYLQAFCRYKGDYYSIDGANIAQQDSEFTVLQDVALNTGHGNGLQLGNANLAYASGWNDNNIYVVDLDLLTLAGTITLPTEGYTTGVVDEVNNLAYVFQRDSYPDTVDNYNFIVYDITNEEIKSTKKILAFGGMQAADFYNDRIIVLNGLGSASVPNGCRVFDTNGNILADYVFGDFSTVEPEGVCIDRSTHELYISFVNKQIYKVTL